MSNHATGCRCKTCVPQPAEEYWRDVGNGMAENGRTKQRIPWRRLRPVAGTAFTLSAEHMTKLQALAKARSNPRKTWTPIECLYALIESAQPGGSGWRPPYEGTKVPL